MRDYIPDLTERFPEGFGGVDMTPSFYGEPVDYTRALGYEPTYDELVEDGEYEPVPFPRETPLTYQFEIGKSYTTTDWFTGGTMKYQYEGRDENRPTVGIFSVEDFEIDGDYYRKEMHDILIDDNGNEYIVIGEYNGHSHCIYSRRD